MVDGHAVLVGRESLLNDWSQRGLPAGPGRKRKSSREGGADRCDRQLGRRTTQKFVVVADTSGSKPTSPEAVSEPLEPRP